ncbi:hypothetical protein NPIL_236781 [Nephila pilipes]|uniref:Uncharacterized protein n=1 Tax=Nephila pilipes TaxID=299642 RepID=A0A8X6MM43_NEPPI|nr:hypothetical protein NPIL_236781 [Nephila pilipes]
MSLKTFLVGGGRSAQRSPVTVRQPVGIGARGGDFVPPEVPRCGELVKQSKIAAVQQRSWRVHLALEEFIYHAL